MSSSLHKLTSQQNTRLANYIKSDLQEQSVQGLYDGPPITQGDGEDDDDDDDDDDVY